MDHPVNDYQPLAINILAVMTKADFFEPLLPLHHKHFSMQ